MFLSSAHKPLVVLLCIHILALWHVVSRNRHVQQRLVLQVVQFGLVRHSLRIVKEGLLDQLLINKCVRSNLHGLDIRFICGIENRDSFSCYVLHVTHA